MSARRPPASTVSTLGGLLFIATGLHTWWCGMREQALACHNDPLLNRRVAWSLDDRIHP